MSKVLIGQARPIGRRPQASIFQGVPSGCPGQYTTLGVASRNPNSQQAVCQFNRGSAAGNVQQQQLSSCEKRAGGGRAGVNGTGQSSSQQAQFDGRHSQTFRRILPGRCDGKCAAAAAEQLRKRSRGVEGSSTGCGSSGTGGASSSCWPHAASRSRQNFMEAAVATADGRQLIGSQRTKAAAALESSRAAVQVRAGSGTS